MSRPTELDLTLAEQPWRSVPMPGANLGLDVVPLASSGETFAILARFPVGFERATAGGYFCAEEFLVLDGSVELEGQSYGRGDLTYVPSHSLRTTMIAQQGCTALAWFGGPAVFRTPEELSNEKGGDEIVSVQVDALLGDNFLVTSEAHWSVSIAAILGGSDGVNIELSRWEHGAEAATVSDLGLRRTPIA